MPDIPAGAKKPADRKPKKTDGPITFEYDGTTYTVDRDAFEDLEVVEALQDEKHFPAIRLILGDAQWTQFKESIRDRKTGRVPADKAEPFINGLFEAVDGANLS